MILISEGSQGLSAHRAHLLPFFLPPAGAGTVTGRDLEHCFPRHGCLRCSLITGLRHFDPSPPAPQYTCTRPGLRPDSAFPDPQDSSKSKTGWAGRWVGGAGARCVARPDSSSPSFPTVGPGLPPTQASCRPSISPVSPRLLAEGCDSDLPEAARAQKSTSWRDTGIPGHSGGAPRTPHPSNARLCAIPPVGERQGAGDPSGL